MTSSAEFAFQLKSELDAQRPTLGRYAAAKTLTVRVRNQLVGGAVRDEHGSNPLPNLFQIVESIGHQPLYREQREHFAAPGAGEINPWVMSSFDIDTIMVDLASSTEYFNKG